MITANQIRDYLQATPFRPFRVSLSDGSKHDVPHPEFAWVFGSTVYIGKPGSSRKLFDEWVKQVALLHVTRVEVFPRTKARK